MATSAEQRAKTDEWEAAETAYYEAATIAQVDADAATVANDKAAASMAAKIQKLKAWHAVDDELDALVLEVEPPDLPDEGLIPEPAPEPQPTE